MKGTSSSALNDQLSKQEYWVLAICIALLVPALLINLGLMAFIDDESIRALVALEMMYSGDYLAPTINGTPYLHKPPLYNWILLISYTLFGEVNEFTSRFPTIIFTMLFGYLVYHLYAKKLGKGIAAVVALLTVTCGRMFFFDSFLGLIDICFSMCMFSLMLGSYYLAEREQWNKLFIFSYSLATVGYLLKAFPTLPFLGITLLVLLISKQKLKKLLSIGHLTGIVIFAFFVFGYYYLYSQGNNFSDLVGATTQQSTDRTIIKHGFGKAIAHIFTFPFEVFYHFLPWTVLAIYLFKKGALKTIWSHPFLKMNVTLLIANILIYWVSPEVYARYILMFPPLIFAPLYYLHVHNKKDNSIHYRIVKGLLYLVIGIVIIGSIGSFFIKEIYFIPNVFLKVAVLCLLCALGAFFLWKADSFHILYALLFICIFRIGFNWFVFPHRNANDYGNELRISATEMAKKYGSGPMYSNIEKRINISTSYYITKQNKRILEAVEKPPAGVFISKYTVEECDEIDCVKNRTRHDGHMIYDCFNKNHYR